MMIRILLVDDHPAVMEGTKMLLEQEAMEVILAHNGEKALEIIQTQDFDVMLFDLQIPDMNGIDLARKVLNITPNAIILIYTGFEISNHFNVMIETGIAGFLLKTANKEQLIAAIRCALRGEIILPLVLAKQLRRTEVRVIEAKNEIEARAVTDQEYVLLKELSRGKSNKEIAEIMMMSQRSLEYKLTNLFQKLNVKSRVEAAMKAKEIGLLTDTDFI